jgi:tetratricopeptide (TPR) repeat protein
MGIRALIVTLVVALAISAAPVQAAKKKAMKPNEQMEISDVYAMGVEQVNGRHWNAGIEAMTKVIDNPKTTKDIMANAYDNRGVCYTNKKMNDKAVADFDKAVELQPNLQSALYHRARALAAMGKHAEAVADLDKVISMENAGSQPSLATADYYYNRGISEMGMSPPDPEKAKADFAMAKKINPKVKIPVKYKHL